MNAVGKVAVFALALACTAGGATTAQAQSFHHVDELALRLEVQTARLAADLRYHYRHTPQFRHLYHDAMEMNRLARHIHDLVQRGDSLDHVRADVAELNELFHHLQDLAAELGGPGRHRGHGYLGGGHFGGYHGGGYHGGRRLWERLASIGDTLHHLADDLDRHNVTVVAPAPLPPPPPIQPTITFGTRRFSITLSP